jgi:hypothetical protein
MEPVVDSGALAWVVESAQNEGNVDGLAVRELDMLVVR